MFDVIVIGVGGMGSATACHLVTRGVRVLALEQFSIPHDRGSSHGATRIIRLAYSEHPAYVPLLRRSYELWRALESTAGERLLVITGGLDIGTEASGTIVGSLDSCRIHDLPHELLTADSLARRFPAYRLPASFMGVHQPDAGFLLSERCIVAHTSAARALGAEIHTGEQVTGWDAGPAHVDVRTARSTYRARRLVVTAGPWAQQLVPALAGLASPERQVLLWTRPTAPELFEADRFPVFVIEGEAGRFYGFPLDPDRGFKIGRYHHRHEAVDPDHIDRSCDAEDERVLREGIREYFPAADGPTVAMQTCMFTNSPDEHFILDHHPELPNVSIAAGFSGHGFKFCSIVGEIMADLSLDGETRWDIGLFRLGRFQGIRERERDKG